MRIFEWTKRKSKVEIVLYSVVSLLFLAVALSYVYILVWAFISGCKTHTEIVMDPFSLPETWHLEHFKEVLESLQVNQHGFFEMLFNSTYFSLFGVLIQQFCSITLAYVCAKYRFPGSNLIYMIVLVVITLPIYGSGGAQYALFHGLGLVDSYAQIISSTGAFNIFFLYYVSFFKNLSWTYAEAAMIDGAENFAIYFRVMLPQARPMFGALFLTQWIGVWNSYESALIYLPNLPTLPVGIYQFNAEMIYRARLDILFAACVIITIPALLLFIIFNKTITSNVSLGGIKG